MRQGRRITSRTVTGPGGPPPGHGRVAAWLRRLPGLLGLALALALALAGGPSALAQGAGPASAAASVAGQGASAPHAARSVLILSGLQYGLPVPDTAIASATAALKQGGVSSNDIFVEHLDLARNAQSGGAQVLAEVLRDKMAGREVGLVMVLNQLALDFMAQPGNVLAPPGVPVLAAYVERTQLTWRGTPRPVINISDVADIAGTVRLGLALFPQTRRVLLVGSADDRELPFFDRARQVIAALPQAPTVETAARLSHDEMLRHVATLPRDTLVLMGTYFNDVTGRRYVPAEVAGEVGRQSSVPVLGLYDIHVRQGLTGGSVLQAAAVGQRAGEIGLALLAGTRRPEAAVSDTAVPPQPMFDWVQLQRWGADPARLPAGTLFLNRPRTLWSEYQGAVIAAAGTIALLAALVAALATQNRRRHRLEHARRQAERAMRDEIDFSNTMLDSMPGVVYFYDLQGRFLRWNRNFEVVTGCGPQEVARMHPLDFFDGEHRERVQARIADVFQHGEASVEALFRSKDGTLTPYFFTGRQVVFNGQPCLVGVGIDISDRLRAEHALRDSQAQLVEAQRIASLGSWTLDVARDHVTASEQTWAICEREGATRAASWAQVLGLFHAEDRVRLDAAQRALVAGGSPMDLELRLVPAPGREKIVHVLGSLQRDDQGQPVLVTGTLHDITVRVRLAAERERREQAEAADRIKSAFLATMSHELRTPLNSIIGFTGILLQGLAGPLNPEQNTQLGMVRASARHLLALVNDVLDISKIEAGQLEIAARPFDLRAAIDKVVQLIEPQVRAKQLALRVAVDGPLGVAVGDERRFQQIALNLLSNAVKFTEHGEVVLRARCTDAPEQLQLQVSDTGIGIQAGDLPHLFQPFRQIDDGLARQHEGTGLGLAICQRLAGLMGGSIGVQSEWGRGSTFTLTMDLERPTRP